MRRLTSVGSGATEELSTIKYMYAVKNILNPSYMMYIEFGREAQHSPLGSLAGGAYDFIFFVPTPPVVRIASEIRDTTRVPASPVCSEFVSVRVKRRRWRIFHRANRIARVEHSVLVQGPQRLRCAAFRNACSTGAVCVERGVGNRRTTRRSSYPEGSRLDKGAKNAAEVMITTLVVRPSSGACWDRTAGARSNIGSSFGFAMFCGSWGVASPPSSTRVPRVVRARRKGGYSLSGLSPRCVHGAFVEERRRRRGGYGWGRV